MKLISVNISFIFSFKTLQSSGCDVSDLLADLTSLPIARLVRSCNKTCWVIQKLRGVELWQPLGSPVIVGSGTQHALAWLWCFQVREELSREVATLRRDVEEQALRKLRKMFGWIFPNEGCDVIRFSLLAWVPGEGRSTEAIGVLGTRLLSVYWGTGQGFLGRDLSSFGTPSGGRRKFESLDWVRVRKITAPSGFFLEISPFFSSFLLLTWTNQELFRKSRAQERTAEQSTAEERSWRVAMVGVGIWRYIETTTVGSLGMEVTTATRKVKGA